LLQWLSTTSSVPFDYVADRRNLAEIQMSNDERPILGVCGRITERVKYSWFSGFGFRHSFDIWISTFVIFISFPLSPLLPFSVILPAKEDIFDAD
jgi:hypothetical protein